LPTASWGQGVPYNDIVAAQNGNNPALPVGCVATALAITMRYHSWPSTGVGQRSYCDRSGLVQFCHAVNFGAQAFDWDAMPTSALGWWEQNPDVAALMYDCGVLVDMDYEATGSGADAGKIMRVRDHFRYRGIERIGGDFANHITNSLRMELPMPGCNVDHCFVIDGYRESPSPFYHINAGYAGLRDGWYNFDWTPSGNFGGSALGDAFPYMAPTNYVYVDGVQRGNPSGTPTSAFRTISQGVDAVPSGGHLWIKSGTYTGTGNAPITVSKPVTLRAYYQGIVTIGQ
jgi:hypothetical protein